MSPVRIRAPGPDGGEECPPTLEPAGEWRSGSAPALGLANAERCANESPTCHYRRLAGAEDAEL